MSSNLFMNERVAETIIDSTNPKINRLPTKTSNALRSVMVTQDNLEFMSGLDDGSMKLIVTSPPYNIGKSYKKQTAFDHYIENQAQVISECVRLLHRCSSICWQVGNHVDKGEIIPLDLVFYRLFKDRGLKLRNRIIWHFEHGLHCKKRLSGRYETIMWFTKKGLLYFQPRPSKGSFQIPTKKIL